MLTRRFSSLPVVYQQRFSRRSVSKAVKPRCNIIPRAIFPPEYNGLYISIGASIVLYGLGMYMLSNPKRNAMSIIQSIGKKYETPSDIPAITFDDVAGIDNAKEALAEIIDFMKNTETYTKMGARIPKGVLLVGPPGTGKTLLSKAVAGEAGVPFFSCSGSEFIELFVGTGAARMRELFKKAKEHAPCIIFIDEIDAIGKKRAVSPSSSNDERDQTLNQLLVEMDGFSDNNGILMIAATNRAELLDDALLRPGRFDRKVYVELPSMSARKDILSLYLENKPVRDIDVNKLAKMSTTFSGADLENWCNETAIYAARNKKEVLTQDLFEMVFDKLTLGPESKDKNHTIEKKQKIIAVHEAGHALAGVLLGEFDTFRKVSIVARGAAGGTTFFEPSEDQGLYSREYLYNHLIVLLAGRAAEQITFGSKQITTGASNDIERATQLALDMITKYGFNETMGPLNLTATDLFAKDAASEVRFLVDHAYQKACDLLRKYEKYLIQLSTLLLERETLGAEEIIEALDGLDCHLVGVEASAWRN